MQDTNLVQKLDELVTWMCKNPSWEKSDPVKNARHFIKQHKKSTMKTILPAAITTVEEAKAFLTELHKNGEAYHPEEDAHYLHGEPFNKEEAQKLNDLMDEIYALPGNDGRHDNIAFDPCEHLLLLEDWECTDPDCNQYRKTVVEDQIYIFREDRIVDPETGRTEVYEAEMNYEDYTWDELVEACKPFGYSAKQVDKWITAGEEIPLMLECIFEQEG